MNLADSSLSSPILDYLKSLHAKYISLDEGAVATYIPELAKADPSLFGICLVTADGQIYEVGDSQHSFTIQSISKPFVYGMALEDKTRTEVFTKIGVEPTGDAFNAISLEPDTGRPRNPMINAGAIAAVGQIAGKSQNTRLQRILDTFSLYAGRELALDSSVYQSESDTGHRNRAIGYMLRNFDILTEDPLPVVDLYFKQCSLSVTCRDLAIMGATLANHGINPVTGKRAIRGEYVESVLSVMASCGMYDYAGEWIYRVGMPAKSGVAGGIVAVLPGQLGIGIFSPPLDVRGNSVRGIKVCDDLSRHFDLHLFNSPHTSSSVVRLEFNGSEVNSSRVRTPEEASLLRTAGRSIQVLQLQGNLVFSTAEVVVREAMKDLGNRRFIILDLKRTLVVNESTCRLFHQLLLKLASSGIKLIFTHIFRAPMLRRYMKAKLGENWSSLFHFFDDNDPALEWCENHLLAELHPNHHVELSATHSEYEMLEGLTPAEVSIVSALFVRHQYRKGSVVVNAGDAARELFVLARGTVSVTVTLASGMQKRLATFSPGMAFGEMALLDESPRSAVVMADTDVECDLLPIEAFERLEDTHPHIKIVLLRNLARYLSTKLRKANREVSIFDY
ncbi:glutaminase A [Verrucomicrobium spinosum]|uniref:glutaminase A n=2 Tax=Verrucomicrobium spinosum TaxID=2736 RepID=UPI0001745B25|nr:glutaminase A [Verrucomicrobium spinosum]